MNDRTTILNLLNKFSSCSENMSWKMKCAYSDGMGTTINEIVLLDIQEQRTLGMFAYQIETGIVMRCTLKSLRSNKSQDIIDLLLDLINRSNDSSFL